MKNTTTTKATETENPWADVTEDAVNAQFEIVRTAMAVRDAALEAYAATKREPTDNIRVQLTIYALRGAEAALKAESDQYQEMQMAFDIRTRGELED